MKTSSKEYLVEVRTQFDTCSQRTKDWGEFNTYTADSKSDAIRQARQENESGGCFDGRTHGLIWWRAIELTEGEGF